MMKMKHIFAVLGLVSLPAMLMAADGIREGMWEITSRMEIPGMPMEMPPTIVKHCYTSEDVKDQKKVISNEKDCAVTDFNGAGNKVSWKMKCTGQHAGKYTGETVFSGDSYNSFMKMESERHAMNMKIIGKRVGNCP